MFLIGLLVALASFMIATLWLAIRRDNLREELKISNRDLEYLRNFFRYYCPAELVKSRLAAWAADVNRACDSQCAMQSGKWTPPAGINPSDKEAVAMAFAENYSARGDIVKRELSYFWDRHKVALLAADAARLDLELFGVDRNQSSWKDSLPGAPTKATPPETERSSKGLHDVVTG